MNVGNKVRVVKTFEAARTPCPKLGTIGRIVDASPDYFTVAFPLPVDSTNGLWLSHGQDKEFMRINFRPDEIEVVEDETNPFAPIEEILEKAFEMVSDNVCAAVATEFLEKAFPNWEDLEASEQGARIRAFQDFLSENVSIKANITPNELRKYYREKFYSGDDRDALKLLVLL